MVVRSTSILCATSDAIQCEIKASFARCQKCFIAFHIMSGNNDRFCNTTVSVALTDTVIQSDDRLQAKEVLLTSDSKQMKTQGLS